MGIIEAAATALALPYLSAEDLGEAEKVNATMAMLLDHFDATVFTQLNHRFHAWLYEPCPNAHLVGLVRRGWSQLSGLRTSTFDYVPDRAALSVREHTEILAMIRDHASPADIEMAVRQHRWRTLEAYLERRSPAEAPTARGGDGVPGPAPHPREVHHG
jgi:DNA-binding GntR family transcriptional regulator